MMMLRATLQRTLAATLSLATGVAFGFDLEVKGIDSTLDGALKENVLAHCAAIDEADNKRLYRTQVKKAIDVAMQALGYYGAEVAFAWEKEKLVATIASGEPVKLQAIDVQILGAGRQDEDFQKLYEKLPSRGAILHHGDYENFKKAIEDVAFKKGYFDGHFVKKELGIDATMNRACWILIYDTGERYRLGALQYRGQQIKDSILYNLVPFQEGDVYTTQAIAELNKRLSDTGWFSAVVVTPDVFAGRASAEHLLPIVADVTPRKANTMQVGLGFATNDGPRGRLTWTKPWLNPEGHSLEMGTSVNRYEQTLNTSYKIPLEVNAIEEYWQVEGELKREDLNDTESNGATLKLSRFWDRQDGWMRSVNLTTTFDSFTQGGVSQDSLLIYPGVSFSRTQAKGGLMPTWGQSQRYSASVSSDFWGSETNFVRLEAEHALVRSFADNHRFVLRSHLGWIQADDFKKVPPDMRFFAGGDRSLRGYDYESISPEDNEGRLTGASKLATASIEYQFRVTGPWWGAAFVDAGDAIDDWGDFKLKKAVGFGLRWTSPMGPIKLDIARPVGDANHKDWQFYIGLGPEL